MRFWTCSRTSSRAASRRRRSLDGECPPELTEIEVRYGRGKALQHFRRCRGDSPLPFGVCLSRSGGRLACRRARHPARRIFARTLPLPPRAQSLFRAARCCPLRQPRWLPLQPQTDAKQVPFGKRGVDQGEGILWLVSSRVCPWFRFSVRPFSR